MRCRDERREDRKGVDFAQAALDQYGCDSTDLLHSTSLAERSQFVALL